MSLRPSFARMSGKNPRLPTITPNVTLPIACSSLNPVGPEYGMMVSWGAFARVQHSIPEPSNPLFLTRFPPEVKGHFAFSFHHLATPDELGRTTSVIPGCHGQTRWARPKSFEVSGAMAGWQRQVAAWRWLDSLGKRAIAKTSGLDAATLPKGSCRPEPKSFGRAQLVCPCAPATRQYAGASLGRGTRERRGAGRATLAPPSAPFPADRTPWANSQIGERKTQLCIVRG